MNQTTLPINAAHADLMKRATYLSVGTAALLIGIKLIAWLICDSLTVFASLVDSCMDAAASIINMLAVGYSLKSADDDHRFGHGKAEALAGLGQAFLIACSAIFLLTNAVKRLLNPPPLTSIGIGLVVMFFAIVTTLLLLSYQRYVVKITGSNAIKADSLHYASDLLTNLATIAALFFANFGMFKMDPLFALAISCYIIYSAWKIGIESVHLLMDHELSTETQKIISQLAFKNSNVLGIHDLRTRKSGRILLIQLHLELNDQMPLLDAHAIAKDVERRIQEHFPDADILIHQDPICMADRHLPSPSSK